ncbi:HNH endonuclease signature motif containing protein [Paracoccus sp. pheM1]|uniref:HNH endonuclease signature motif containing protein n=1 Tax=Paracoccus sp. pheM1 TaxID=2831675 RepID=UPI001BDB7E2E|nr:HNH endonuclease signature motif containing protein [Paracoccus sp. pheM1]MBT0780853.1 HNH endonuclease [Paracoccus sp. pheM1]
MKELLAYDPATGSFHWRVNLRGPVKAGDVAGVSNPRGYRVIHISGKNYLAHRLAFLYMTGSFPPNMADHINGDPSDNRWSNLRPATGSQNNANARARSGSRLGVKGVYKRGSRYVSQICHNGDHKYLGTFDTISDAKAAYDKAANYAFGVFARSA